MGNDQIVNSGDRVDILGLFSFDGGKHITGSNNIPLSVLKNVKVLDATPEGEKWKVLFELNAKQFKELSFAERKGELQIKPNAENTALKADIDMFEAHIKDYMKVKVQNP